MSFDDLPADAPADLDQVASARAGVLSRRRRAAVVAAAGLAAVAVALSALVWTGALGSAGRSIADRDLGGVPPSVVPLSSPTSTPSASSTAATTSTAESRLVEAMDAYLEADREYTALDAAVPWGGRMFCATVLDSTSRDGDMLYAYALCGQVYVDDGSLTVGTASAGPVVFTAEHHTNRSGDYVVDRITDVGWPRQQHLQSDYERLFPPDVRERLPTGGYEKAPSQQDLFDRAQPELDAGRLGPGTPEAIAAAFLEFARGNRDTIPSDTPVRLYLGNAYVRTIPSAEVDQRASWQMCRTPYAQRDCPFDPLDVFDEGDIMTTISTHERTSCLQTLTDAPSDTGGSRTIAIVPYDAPDCAGQYAVQLWINDVGQITAVNLLLGHP